MAARNAQDVKNADNPSEAELAERKEVAEAKAKQDAAEAQKIADGPKRGEDNITPPGALEADGEKISVRATGAFLVYDPYTLDHVGEAGGEMRVTEFVRAKLAEGKLEKA